MVWQRTCHKMTTLESCLIHHNCDNGPSKCCSTKSPAWLQFWKVFQSHKADHHNYASYSIEMHRSFQCPLRHKQRTPDPVLASREGLGTWLLKSLLINRLSISGLSSPVPHLAADPRVICWLSGRIAECGGPELVHANGGHWGQCHCWSTCQPHSELEHS